MKYPRSIIILSSAAAALYVFAALLFAVGSGYKKELKSVQAKMSEFITLSEEYKTLKAYMDKIEQKTMQPKTAGLIQIVNDMAGSLGIKGKIKSIKASGSREAANFFLEESGEVVIERLTMNEMVNLFYTIDNASVMLSIKQVRIKKSFENPDMLDVNLTLSVYNKK
jgi:hypothetical protein